MKSYFLLLFAMLYLAGCGQTLSVAVNSFAEEDARSKRRFILAPGSDQMNSTGLEYREFASLVDRALQQQGFEPAAGVNDAELIIFIDYEVSSPTIQSYSYSVPIHGQTGVSSSHTSGSITNYGGGVRSFSGTTHYQPTYGVTGYQNLSGTYMTFMRFFSLTAFDVARAEQHSDYREFWKVSAVSSGTNPNLRDIFPYLLHASMNYFGSATKNGVHRRSYTLGDKDVLRLIGDNSSE